MSLVIFWKRHSRLFNKEISNDLDCISSLWLLTSEYSVVNLIYRLFTVLPFNQITTNNGIVDFVAMHFLRKSLGKSIRSNRPSQKLREEKITITLSGTVISSVRSDFYLKSSNFMFYIPFYTLPPTTNSIVVIHYTHNNMVWVNLRTTERNVLCTLKVNRNFIVSFILSHVCFYWGIFTFIQFNHLLFLVLNSHSNSLHACVQMSIKISDPHIVYH